MLGLPLLFAGGSLLKGLFGGKKDKSKKPGVGGARIEDLLPMLMPLLQQQQAASKQNYDLQTQRYMSALPLRDMALRMTMNLMPRGYAQSMPQMPSQQTPQAPPPLPTIRGGR